MIHLIGHDEDRQSRKDEDDEATESLRESRRRSCELVKKCEGVE